MYKTIVLRVLLQAAMIAGVLLAIHYMVGDHLLLNLAVVSYMSSPATFSMQTFLKSEEGSAYVSTTNSLYCLVSILVYVVMAFDSLLWRLRKKILHVRDFFV